jgi:hypothetical protein
MKVMAEFSFFAVDPKLEKVSIWEPLIYLDGNDLTIKEWSNRLSIFHWMILMGDLESELGLFISSILVQTAKHQGVLTTSFLHHQEIDSDGLHQEFSMVSEIFGTTIFVPSDINEKHDHLGMRMPNYVEFDVAWITSAIIDLIASFNKPGFIGIDFVDYRQILANNQTFIFGQGIGLTPNQAFGNALRSSNLKGIKISACDQIIVAVSSGQESFSIEISEFFSDRFDDASDCLFYHISDESLGNYVKISLYLNPTKDVC